ncbi:MAG: amidohydrolase family protein [Actinomycetota bacterium]
MSNTAPADLAIIGGDVRTIDRAGTRASAVAIRDGRIVAVGSDEDVRAVSDPSTELIDARGRTVLPGFQDAHIHAPSAGLDRLRIDLLTAHSIDEYEERVLAYAARNLDREWILGGGWVSEHFPGGWPTAELLDRWVADRPVFLANAGNHGAWVNGRAMELAGITRDTPDPPDGRFERDAQGEPTGVLHEGAMDTVRRLIGTVDPDEQLDGLLEAQRYLHAVGITGWQDAIVGTYPTLDDSYETYLRASGSGALTARVVGALWWDRSRDESQLPFLLDRRSRAAEVEGRFRATSVKIMADGVCENFTAALLDPYVGEGGVPTDNRGISFVERDDLLRVAPLIDAEGFQLHIHVIGDRAARDALDAIEAARAANGPNDRRHHLAHLHVVHPDDVPRFARLGVVANCQPLWAAHGIEMDEFTSPQLGDPRWRWQYPFGGLARSGATLAFGSDWPVSSPNPFEEMHVAVHRIEPPGVEGASDVPVFLPDERLDLDTSIRAFTMGSAYVNHLDDVTGSLEPGKLADLIVLDRALDDAGTDGFSDTRVLLTLVEGERVHEAPGL